MEIIIAAASCLLIGYLFGWNAGHAKAHKVYGDQNKWLFNKAMELKAELDQRRKPWNTPGDPEYGEEYDADWWKNA